MRNERGNQTGYPAELPLPARTDDLPRDWRGLQPDRGYRRSGVVIEIDPDEPVEEEVGSFT